jgi:hypothetical protein
VSTLTHRAAEGWSYAASTALVPMVRWTA